jgi:hypothetical protein
MKVEGVQGKVTQKVRRLNAMFVVAVMRHVEECEGEIYMRCWGIVNAKKQDNVFTDHTITSLNAGSVFHNAQV